MILHNPKDYEPIPLPNIDLTKIIKNLKCDKEKRKEKAKERMEKLEKMRLERLKN
jgi:hypothetical protein